MNEGIWFLLLAVDFAFAMLMVRYFGKMGLYSMMILGTIVSNIQVVKIFPLFGIDLNSGNIAYGSIFLATDLLSECYGKKAAFKGVFICFCCAIFFAIVMSVNNLYVPSEHDLSHKSLVAVFSLTPRIVFASLVAFLFSQLHDVWSFDFWKKKYQGRFLWMRNNFSTVASQLIDTIIFTFLAFYGVFEIPVILELIVATIVVKWVVALLDTPFIYWGRSLLQKYHL